MQLLLRRVHTSLKVDRSRLHESVEAWVYVDILDEPYLNRGLTPCKAILTWENSD